MIAIFRSLTAATALAAVLAAPLALAHGDVVPQAVDVHTLKPLGTEKAKSNPYRGDKEAIRIGTSAYNQNCARCHGLDAISGGIAPDLRKLDLDPETDQYFLESVLRGKVRNGNVYMPPFEGILPQEAIWALRSFLDTRHDALVASEGVVQLSDMEQLAKKSGCLSCHAVDARGVGPGYREVTAKYAKDKNAEKKLVAKVTKGGMGVWGKIPMPPMGESVSNDDIKSLVKWVLDGAK
jgi:cytochrome c-550 PedF